MATAADTSTGTACMERTIASRWAAYAVAGSPAVSTTSSAARSRSFTNSRQAIQTSGFHQKSDTAARAISCVAKSPRRMCASSWSITTRRRSSLHSRASAGKKTAGCSTPKLRGIPPRGNSSSATSRWRPSNRARAGKSESPKGLAVRRLCHMTIQAAAMWARASAVPAAQTNGIRRRKSGCQGARAGVDCEAGVAWGTEGAGAERSATAVVRNAILETSGESADVRTRRAGMETESIGRASRAVAAAVQTR